MAAAATVTLCSGNAKVGFFATAGADVEPAQGPAVDDGRFAVAAISADQEGTEMVMDHLDTDEELELNGAVPGWNGKLLRSHSAAAKRSGFMEGLLRLVESEMELSFAFSLLRNKVLYLAMNKVGCRVLLSVMPKLNCHMRSSLVEETLGSVLALSEHKYGSRVLAAMVQCTCLPALGPEQALLQEILDNFDTLVTCPFGHRVVVTVSKASNELCYTVAELLMDHRHGPALMCLDDDFCEVVKCVLRHGPRDCAQALSREIFDEDVLSLTSTTSGMQVLECMLNLGRSTQEDVAMELGNMREQTMYQLNLSKRGRRLARRYKFWQ